MRRMKSTLSLAIAVGLAAIASPAGAQSVHESLSCLVWQANPFVNGVSVTTTRCAFVAPPNQQLPRAALGFHVTAGQSSLTRHAWVELNEWDTHLGRQLMDIYKPEVRVTLACRASGSSTVVWQKGSWQRLSTAVQNTNLRCRYPSVEILEMAQLETRVTW